ncbi:ATP-dependent DNA helicase [bacterium]|nr:ATP-dependent DNA helicase [bacterium]
MVVTTDLRNLDEFFGREGRLAKFLPFYEYREGQVEMAQEVARAIADNQHLVIEAGTGTGKSLAYLLPCLLSGKQCIVSTLTKNLQEQLYYKEVPFMREDLGISFEASTLKGRGNYLCLRRYQRFVRQPYFEFREEAGLFEAITEWVQTTETGDRSELTIIPDHFQAWSDMCSSVETCIGKKCKVRENCFFEKAKQKARKSDLIIINHHLFFADLSLKRVSRYAGVLPEAPLVVIDEAHELEDVATSYFGIRFSYWQLHRLILETERTLTGDEFDPVRADLIAQLRNLEDQARFFFFTLLRQRRREKVRLHADRWNDAQASAFQDMLRTNNQMLTVVKPIKSQNEDLSNLITRWKNMFKEAETITSFKNEDWVYWLETTERNTILAASPIDVSHDLNQEIFQKIPTVVLTSATLATNGNFDFLKGRIGLERSLEKIVESPFDYHRQAYLYVPPRAPDPRDEQFDDFVIKQVAQILGLTEGKAFVLFTSRLRMERTYEALGPKLPIQSFLQGKQPRHQLIEAFKQDINSVLFATSSFWHGVDVVGRSLSCVIIDKLPFSVPDEPVVEARIDYIKRRGGNAFTEFMVPSAIITLKQGIGRLIRSRSDFGLIVVLDRRLVQSSYSHLFLNSLPPLTVIREKALLEHVGQYIRQGKEFDHVLEKEPETHTEKH